MLLHGMMILKQILKCSCLILVIILLFKSKTNPNFLLLECAIFKVNLLQFKTMTQYKRVIKKMKARCNLTRRWVVTIDDDGNVVMETKGVIELLGGVQTLDCKSI
jgi:hypothetical protein